MFNGNNDVTVYTKQTYLRKDKKSTSLLICIEINSKMGVESHMTDEAYHAYK